MGYAGSGVSASLPAVSTDSTTGGETNPASSLTQDDLTELIYQLYRSSGVHSPESMRMLVEQLLRQNEKKDEEQEQDGYIRL